MMNLEKVQELSEEIKVLREDEFKVLLLLLGIKLTKPAEKKTKAKKEKKVKKKNTMITPSMGFAPKVPSAPKVGKLHLKSR